MIGWTRDLRVGWRITGHKVHYYAGDGSLCGVWAQPSVWGKPRKPVFETVPAKYAEMVCATCATARGGR